MKFLGRYSRFAALCLGAAILLGLTGCTGSVKLSNRAIVQAIGVDREQNGYLITLELLDTAGEEGKVNTTQAAGEELSLAFQQAAKRLGKEIFLGDNRLILLGREAVEQKLEETLLYFQSAWHSRPGVAVAAAEGKAADYLKTPEGAAESPADSLSQGLASRKTRPSQCYPHLMGTLRSLMQSEGCGLLPLARLEEGSAGPEGLLDGAAVFSGWQLREVFTQEQKALTSLLQGEPENELFVFPDEQLGEVLCRFYQSRVNIRAELAEQLPVFHITVSLKGRLEASYGARHSGELTDPEVHRWVERLAAEQLEQRLTELVSRLLFEDQADLMELSLLLQRSFPQWWQQHGAEFPGLLQQSGFTLSVSCSVDRLQ